MQDPPAVNLNKVLAAMQAMMQQNQVTQQQVAALLQNQQQPQPQQQPQVNQPQPLKLLTKYVKCDLFTGKHET